MKTIIPAGSDAPDALLDACLAFYPKFFSGCPSLFEVKKQQLDVERIDDFDLGDNVPKGWEKLREEARMRFGELGIAEAELREVRF